MPSSVSAGANLLLVISVCDGIGQVGLGARVEHHRQHAQRQLRLARHSLGLGPEEIRQTLERRPAALVVARVVRPKFVSKERKRDAPTQVFVADPLELPIPKGLAGPGMLADTIVRRWQDHMPLNRLEDAYARDGVELARSTVCGVARH